MPDSEELCRVISLDEFRAKMPHDEEQTSGYMHCDERTFSGAFTMLSFMGINTDDLLVCTKVDDSRHSVYQVKDRPLYAIGRNINDQEAITLNTELYTGRDVENSLLERYYTLGLLARFIMRTEGMNPVHTKFELPRAGELGVAMTYNRGDASIDIRHETTAWRVAAGFALIGCNVKPKDPLFDYLQDTLERRVRYTRSAQEFAALLAGGQTQDDMINIPPIQIGLCNPITDKMKLRGLLPKQDEGTSDAIVTELES